MTLHIEYDCLLGEDFNWCAILDDFEIGRVLGKGGFGEVLYARHKETKKDHAVKFMDVSDQLSNAGLISSIFKEAESLKKLKHKNIVQLDHAFLEGKQLIMIMEYAGGGEVLEYLEAHKKLDEITSRKIML